MKKYERKMVVGAILIFAVVMIGIIFFVTRENTIDLNNYLSVEFNGVDTKGKANLIVDSERLEIDIFKATGGKVDGSEIENNIELNLKMNTLIDSYDFYLDKQEDLANGDIVTVDAAINNDFAKENNFVFKFQPEKIEVSGLSEAIVLTSEDIFNENNLIVEYAGVSPLATAQIRNISKDNIISQLEFSANRASGLKKGDEIIVSIESGESMALESGYIIEDEVLENGKVYTVDAVDEYITSLEQIDDATMDRVIQQAVDILESWKANMCSGDTEGDSIRRHEYTEFKKEADLFLSLKDGVELSWGSNCHNRLCLVYSVHETYTQKLLYNDEKVSETDIYLGIVFNNLILRDDGSLDVVITDGALFSEYSDYVTYDDIQRDVLTANKQNYNVEEKKAE